MDPEQTRRWAVEQAILSHRGPMHYSLVIEAAKRIEAYVLTGSELSVAESFESVMPRKATAS